MNITNVPSVENWRKIVSRGKYPLLFIYELNHGLLNVHKVTGFKKIKLRNYCRLKGASYLYEPEAQTFARKLREVLRKNPEEALVWVDDYFKKTKKLFCWLDRVNQKIKKDNPSKAELKKLYEEYTMRTVFIWRWGYLPFLMDEAIATELNDLLNNLGVPASKIKEMIKILSASEKLTLHKTQEIELVKLALEVKEMGFLKCRQKIQDYLKKWGWKDSWVYSQHILSLKALRKEILSLVFKNPSRILDNLQNELKEKLQEKKKLLAKLKDKKLKVLSQILAEYNYWHTVKLEEMTRAAYLAKPLFEKLACKLGLSYEQFIELTPEEVAQEKINLSIINERLQDNGILMRNGKATILSLAQIEEVARIFETKLKRVKILRGTVVYNGKVKLHRITPHEHQDSVERNPSPESHHSSTGLAYSAEARLSAAKAGHPWLSGVRVKGRVVIAPSGSIDISKIIVRQGDVLVTSMTTPNMAPLVKNAVAVVTDEGGVLCHAAIIARELNKPCIVGTKIATQVLKDGDIIEVDAEKGVVRILK